MKRWATTQSYDTREWGCPTDPVTGLHRGRLSERGEGYLPTRRGSRSAFILITYSSLCLIIAHFTAAYSRLDGNRL